MVAEKCSLSHSNPNLFLPIYRCYKRSRPLEIPSSLCVLVRIMPSVWFSTIESQWQTAHRNILSQMRVKVMEYINLTKRVIARDINVITTFPKIINIYCFFWPPLVTSIHYSVTKSLIEDHFSSLFKADRSNFCYQKCNIVFCFAI